MNSEPQEFRATSFTAKIKRGEKRQMEIHGSRWVVHTCGVSRSCKVHIQASRQGVICSLESCVVQALC